jgi:hypothetical protein
VLNKEICHYLEVLPNGDPQTAEQIMHGFEKKFEDLTDTF